MDILSTVGIGIGTNILHDILSKKLSLIKDRRAVKSFIRDMGEWELGFEKKHDGTIVTNGAFFQDIQNHNVIENISDYVLQATDSSLDEEAFLDALRQEMVRRIEAQLNQKLSTRDRHIIKEFLQTVLHKTKTFLFDRVTLDERASLYMVRQIDTKIDSSTRELRQSIKMLSSSLQKPGEARAPLLSADELRMLVWQKDEALLNGLILPWLKEESPKFRFIFKELFIKPRVKSAEKRKALPFSGLLKSISGPGLIAVIGDAGCGKSTLLKYLYLYETRCELRFYFTAAEILAGRAPVFYQLTELVDRGDEVAVYIDGLDEAHLFYNEEIEPVMNVAHSLSGQCRILLGARKDFYRTYFSDSDYGLFADTITVEPWTRNMADKYTEKYARKIKAGSLSERYRALADSSPNVVAFTKNPFQLTMLIYLLETKYAVLPLEAWELSGYSAYNLYDDFYDNWRLREQHRKTSEAYRGRDVFDTHYEIARDLYAGRTVFVNEISDTAVTGLLILEETPEGKRASRFFHQSINEYILAKRCLEMFLTGGVELVNVLSELMKNDVTDFVKAAFVGLPQRDLVRMQQNLEEIYYLIYEPDESDTFQQIKNLSERERFTLQDQIIFFVSRIPDLPAEDFIRYANTRETHPIMQLNLAYAAALKGPVVDIALDYAKRIVPGSIEDITNRSWTLVYYGDVREDAYTYRDDGRAPWSKARAARIERFQKDKDKAWRFRMFDLPLLYTFFISHGWNDLSEEEFIVIKKCDTVRPDLPEAVNQFMSEAKEKLCSEYENRLAKIAL